MRTFQRADIAGVAQHIGVLAQVHAAGLAAIGLAAQDRSGRGCTTSKRWNAPTYSSTVRATWTVPGKV